MSDKDKIYNSKADKEKPNINNDCLAKLDEKPKIIDNKCLEHMTKSQNGEYDEHFDDIEVLYDLSELFKVFGDSTRIRILSSLRKCGKCVYHIAEDLDMGQSAISHQLRILRTAGLVKPEREGKTVFYSLDDEHIEQILDIGLKHLLHKDDKNKGGNKNGENSKQKAQI